MKHRNQFAFILGPHRSGSSLVASALYHMGVNLGSQFIEPNDDNPKGFFEDVVVVQFNDRLLRSMNLSWDSFGFIWEQDFESERLKPYHKAAVALVSQRFSGMRLCGLKDPRFCILLPFWKAVISEALDVDVAFVLSIREPAQCVRSQKARHFKDSDFHLLGRRNITTLLLWWTYLFKALAQIDADRLIIVNYASLLEAPELELQRLARLLRVDLLQLEIDSFCHDHVEPLLNRSDTVAELDRSKSPLLWHYADTLYSRLLTLSKTDSLHNQDVAGALENLNIQELEPLYLQELQYMNGYSNKKIISLRHRLIQTIQEVNSERGRTESLRAQNNAVSEAYSMLLDKYNALDSSHQTVLNTRGWKLLTFLRRFMKRPFS